MNKILTTQEAIEITRILKKQNKIIVIAGGFFDILHLGHIRFLEKAKKYGDHLFILLEDDAKAKKQKGDKRPINSQSDRAKVLSAIQNVDYIIMLKNMTNDGLYDKIMVEMQPNVIAITRGDPYEKCKKRQAKLIKAKIVYAIERINSLSTTKYAKLINIKK
jgi:D-beta-D-heptose 7-phosphate kinase/D-beta-D-heptose 1-phosphate adenosyltransferase